MTNFQLAYEGVIALLGSGIGGGIVTKLFGPKAVIVEKQIATEAKRIEPAVLEGIHTLEDLFTKIPELAPLKVKLMSAKNKLEDSEVAVVVRGLLNAYAKDIASLTTDEKATLVLFAQKVIAEEFHVSVTAAQINKVIDGSVSFAKQYAESDAFKQTATTQTIKTQLAQATQQALQAAANGQASQPTQAGQAS